MVFPMTHGDLSTMLFLRIWGHARGQLQRQSLLVGEMWIPGRSKSLHQAVSFWGDRISSAICTPNMGRYGKPYIPTSVHDL